MCSPQIILDKIVEKIVDSVIQLVVCDIHFVCCYKRNLEKLDAEKKNLEEQRQKVNDEVDKYKTLGEDIEANVSNWLTEADKMIKEVEEFVNHKTDKESMQCFKFSCPDYISRYKLSKEAERKIGDIKNLTQKGKFVSRESVFNRIMDALKDLNACKIGVHGPGGVGKTKMVEEVSKQVKEDGLFDEVVMAVVSQYANVSKIQLQLVGGLNPKPDVETITDDHERAKKLWQRLDNGKKNLIILDDIWHELNLTTIGIPIKDRNKVVITSQNRDVWKNMEMDTEIQITVLSETESWDLFKKKVGDSVDSPELHDIAKQVCEECQGLPVTILVVGGALKGKEKYVWKNALEKLKKSMLKKIEGIDPKLYNSLKLSYDQLSMDAKSCFLLCCMFPEDAEIPIDELVRHCTARRLLAEKQDTLETARDAVRTVVDTLKTRSLLLDDTNKNVVKMHDVIRDVAVSIADDDKAILVKHGVHEWSENGMYESYLAISLRSKTVHEVPNKLGCPQLHTLLLECIVPLVIIPDMFFDGMEKLTVLELNGLCMLQLPPSLANLVNLRMLYLNDSQLEDITILKDLKNNLEILSLRGSDIEVLPSEIGQLTQLRLLDLRNCKKLSKIPQGVISNLSRLEELYILDSFDQWEDATTNKERSNVSLDELRKLTQLTTLQIHIPNAMLLPKDIRFENLIRFIISMGERFDYFEYQSSTRMFKLVGVPFRDEFNVLLERAEVLHLEKVEGLQKVYHGLYPSCGRGLLQIQRLVIKDCEVMEGIFGNGEKNEEAVTSEAINFSQLKYMKLESLPSLVSFYPKMEKTRKIHLPKHTLFNEKVMFPALEELSIDGLRKLTEIWDRKLLPLESFKELRDVTIWCCEKLVNVGSSNMHLQLPKLKNLNVWGCRELKVVVLENGEEEEKAENNTSSISFPYLTSMNFGNLKSLKSFCTSRSETQSLFTSQVAFLALEELLIFGVPNITEIWSNQFPSELKVNCFEKLMNVVRSSMLPTRHNQRMLSENAKEKAMAQEKKRNDDAIVFPRLRTVRLDNLQNLETFCRTRISEAQTLFNHQIACPQLRVLSVGWLPNITDVWDKKLLPTGSFCELREVRIEGCDKLVNVILSNMLPRLQNLTELSVRYCPMVEEILSEKGEEKADAEAKENSILFPQLKTIELGSLENLKSFCSSRLAAQHFFKHRAAFAALEELHICNLPNITKIWGKQLLPVPKTDAQSFEQLAVVNATWCEKLVNVIPSSMFPRLKNLKSIYVKGCPEMEVIVSKKANATVNGNIIFFPRLSSVSIEKLYNLKSFCSSSPSSETQPLFNDQVVFPVLEDLFINRVRNITNIWDKLHSIESFCSLRRMMIEDCEKLVNIVPSYMLPQLQNLEVLNVYSCLKMLVIVSEEEGKGKDVDENTILFPKLTTLNLKSLDNLKTFYTQPFLNHQVALPKLKNSCLDQYLQQRLLKGKECAIMNENDDKEIEQDNQRFLKGKECEIMNENDDKETEQDKRRRLKGKGFRNYE